MDSKWQRVILLSLCLSRQHMQRPIVRQPYMLHYSNWPMSHLREGPHWFLFIRALWNYNSTGVKYWCIKGVGSLSKKPAGEPSESRKPSATALFCSVISGALRSVSVLKTVLEPLRKVFLVPFSIPATILIHTLSCLRLVDMITGLCMDVTIEYSWGHVAATVPSK